MRVALRAVLAIGVLAGTATLTTPAAQAQEIWPPDWGYQCVRYPCYPEDYIECTLHMTCFGRTGS